jgi:hypothetical protein
MMTNEIRETYYPMQNGMMNNNQYPFGLPHATIPPMFFSPEPTFFQQTRFPIKKLMERFFIESAHQEKNLIRTTLYALMIHIDSKYESIHDPRIRGRMFFSYCDEFDAYLIKPLIQECIGKKNEEIFEAGEGNRSRKQAEMDCLLKFLVWLTEKGLIDFSIKIPDAPEIVNCNGNGNYRFQRDAHPQPQSRERKNNLSSSEEHQGKV